MENSRWIQGIVQLQHKRIEYTTGRYYRAGSEINAWGKNESDHFIFFHLYLRPFGWLVIFVQLFKLFFEIAFATAFHLWFILILAKVLSDIVLIDLVIPDDPKMREALGQQA